MNTDKQEYDRFIEAMLQAKFQSAYTDEEIIIVRNWLYKISEIVYEDYVAKCRSGKFLQKSHEQ